MGFYLNKKSILISISLKLILSQYRDSAMVRLILLCCVLLNLHIFPMNGYVVVDRHDADVEEINECKIEGICGHRGICRDTLESYHCTCDDLHIGGGISNPCKEMTMWVFDIIDKNNDGFADWSESVSSLGQRKVSKQQMEELMKITKVQHDDADTDEDGRISHLEFDTLVTEAIKDDPKKAFSTYRVYDLDRNGHINAVEYHAKQAQRFGWTMEEAQTILDRADKRGNGDGAVDFVELGMFSFETHKEDMHGDDDDDEHSHEDEHGDDDDHSEDDDDHE